MDRKKFITTCGFACVGGIGLAGILESCGSTKILNGKIINDDLVIPLSDFQNKKGEKISYKKYLVVQNDILQYPVCVFRFNDNEYTALWMRCTHQEQSYRYLEINYNALRMAVSSQVSAVYKMAPQIRSLEHFL